MQPYLHDKSEIVANQDHSSIEFIDGFSQSIDGLNVQMIGGFIEK